MPNPAVHFEIDCINTDAQRYFYSTLSDWQIKSTGEGGKYGLIQTAESAITGGICHAVEMHPQ